MCHAYALWSIHKSIHIMFIDASTLIISVVVTSIVMNFIIDDDAIFSFYYFKDVNDDDAVSLLLLFEYSSLSPIELRFIMHHFFLTLSFSLLLLTLLSLHRKDCAKHMFSIITDCVDIMNIMCITMILLH